MRGRRSAPERAAAALLLPAGVAGYVYGIVTERDFVGFSVWLPCIVSGFLVLGILYLCRLPGGGRLGFADVLMVSLMHVLGGAVVARLVETAATPMALQPSMLPILEWTRPAMLALFAVTDIVALAVMWRQERVQAEG